MGKIKFPFLEQLLKIVPDNPVSKTQYIYYLTGLVFFGLIGFSIATWIQVFTFFSWTTLFRGVFMTAIAFLSLAGFKQSKQAYETVKTLINSTSQGASEPLQSKEDMLNEFQN